MALYAIGDVQGCFASLRALLGRVGWKPARDRLWLTGDLVNRGPDSLEVLRWAREHDAAITCVLGNHDLHFLARAADLEKPKSRDTLDELLAAPDLAELVDWLRRRPFLHRDGARVLVHAGLLPSWTVAEAARLAAEAAAGLAGSGWRAALATLRHAKHWREPMKEEDRLGAAVRVMTRIRTCTLELEVGDFDGPPIEAPPGQLPWFEHPKRASRDHTILFGHWSALGLQKLPGVLGLDTGCVWGRELTAVRLDDDSIFQQPSLE